ncbi:hypothetical protein PR048_007754 [Dryococelus australis]|uniref:Uncharacterized protein n=1 Tax=Dryococelus australis TaxID=614101 RepID=A0ABQ9HV50_9NEOP|nr:hypothetical protein PR048_007754 [Dryococelus australis]
MGEVGSFHANRGDYSSSETSVQKCEHSSESTEKYARHCCVVKIKSVEGYCNEWWDKTVTALSRVVPVVLREHCAPFQNLACRCTGEIGMRVGVALMPHSLLSLEWQTQYRCRSPVAQSVGAPPIWDAGGSGFESRPRAAVNCDLDLRADTTRAICFASRRCTNFGRNARATARLLADGAKRGSDKDNVDTHAMCPFAPTRKALNWRAVFLSCCVYLWDFQRAGMQGRDATGDPRENPPTSGIVRHDSPLLKSGSDLGIEPFVGGG